MGQHADSLSAREWQIIHLASEGLIDKQISEVLCLSLTTVRTYWERIRQKLGTVNRTHSVWVALFSRMSQLEKLAAAVAQNDENVSRTLAAIQRDLDELKQPSIAASGSWRESIGIGAIPNDSPEETRSTPERGERIKRSASRPPAARRVRR